MKHLVFLAALIILLLPIIQSLRRTGFLWEREKLKRRLILTGKVYGGLAILAIPFGLTSAGFHYGRISIAPFETITNWYYRRLLMPSMAHFLGFEGQLFYFFFSIAVNFILIFFVAAYLEHSGIKVTFLRLLSLATSGFIIFNFMAVGFADPLMFIFFLIALFAADTSKSRLSIVALCLLTHEGSVFILIPMIFFLFPREEILKCLSIVALYSGLYFLSFQLNMTDMVTSQYTSSGRIGIDWAIAYPWRTLGGWLLSYKLLWLIIIFALYRMIKAGELAKALTVASFSIGAPLIINVFTVDVYRHVGEGFCGLLISYTYLMKSEYGRRVTSKALMVLNILVPSIYVGTNNGFRFAPGLYAWLCNVVGLQGWLARL